MKCVIGLICAATFFSSAHAQSLEAGAQHYYYGRYESAENAFHNQLISDPGNGSLWLWLAESYIQQDEAAEAIDSLRMAPPSVHDDPYYKIARGAVLLAVGKTDSATLFFSDAIDDTKGKNAKVLGEIAEMHIVNENGNANVALELIDKALKRDKHNAELYVLKGNAHRKLHDANAAFQSYKEAIGEDKGLAEAYYQLGDIFVGQKNEDVYVDYFKQALAADNNYAPAHYALYRHYVNSDPATAMQHFSTYEKLADKSVQNEYAYTDLLYLNKNYQDAINHAIQLLQSEGDKAQPRLYKLIAYSYQAQKDSVSAISYMQEYFRKEADSNFLVKDFETMAGLYERDASTIDSAMIYYQRALPVAVDSATLYEIYDKLADLAKAKGDYLAEAQWLGKYYTGNERATNVNLFNWGLALYRSKEYKAADSVFGLYTDKYPEQGFGYYWRARSNAAFDDEMKEGLAIPHYTKLIEMLTADSVATTISATDKKWLIEAYGYMAAYETNAKENYPEAISWFNRLLGIDPANENAKKYIAILEQNIAKGQAGKQEKQEKESEEGKN